MVYSQRGGQMILYEKLKGKYGENLKEKLTERLYHKIAAKKSFYLHNVVKCGIDLEDLGYTFEDYVEDFRDQANKYVEKKTVYNIIKKGYAPGSFVNTTFADYLKEGFNYNSKIIKKERAEEILEVLDIDCDLERYNLRLETYKRHIELYGAKEDLESFQEDFSIKQPILWENKKEKWHLAFDGLLCECIKMRNK